jgi:hypothetical protein
MCARILAARRKAHADVDRVGLTPNCDDFSGEAALPSTT